MARPLPGPRPATHCPPRSSRRGPVRARRGHPASRAATRPRGTSCRPEGPAAGVPAARGAGAERPAPASPRAPTTRRRRFRQRGKRPTRAVYALPWGETLAHRGFCPSRGRAGDEWVVFRGRFDEIGAADIYSRRERRRKIAGHADRLRARRAAPAPAPAPPPGRRGNSIGHANGRRNPRQPRDRRKPLGRPSQGDPLVEMRHPLGGVGIGHIRRQMLDVPRQPQRPAHQRTQPRHAVPAPARRRRRINRTARRRGARYAQPNARTARVRPSGHSAHPPDVSSDPTDNDSASARKR